MKPTDAFVDEVRITVSSGRGGDGCVSMRRERFVPRGGPDGGDGGKGGDVVLVADPGLRTLLDYRYRREIRADAGARGQGARKNGVAGRNVELRVPVGTVVFDEGAGGEQPLVDLSEDGQCFVLARGGGGGAGNSHFATSTRQAPDFAKPGQPSETRSLRLTLKLVADVGLIGLPNAGKSTLLRRISAARPRVASYPFTTLVPSLGVAELDDRRFVVADIPGLIEGASKGVGLGDRFLRHIERTRVLVHLLDVGAMEFEGRDPIADYEVVRKELGRYQPALLERTEIVALNKVDVVSERGRLTAVEDALRSRCAALVWTSGATGEGAPELLRQMVTALDAVGSAVGS